MLNLLSSRIHLQTNCVSVNGAMFNYTSLHPAQKTDKAEDRGMGSEKHITFSFMGQSINTNKNNSPVL